MTSAHFEAMSAVLSGVKEVREVLRAAEERRRREGRRTILLIDEIHRFNKAQQDALSPTWSRATSCSGPPPRTPPSR
jgi:putative ATPase